MQSKCVLSIIITVYNMEKYLQQCLDSISNQSVNDFELLIVDDGSNDKSAEIVDDFAKTHQNVVVIHKQNGGLIDARRAGFMASRGEYIYFVDADDWIEPSFCNRTIDIIGRYRPQIINVGLYREYENFHTYNYAGLDEGLYGQNELRERMMQIYEDGPWFLPPFVHAMCVNIFRRELFQKIDESAEDMSISNGEDTIRVGAMMLSAKSVYISHDYLYHYRMRDDSMSHKAESRDLQSCIKMGKEMINVIKRTVEIDDIIKKYIADILFFSLAYMSAGYLFNRAECIRCFPKVKDGDRIIIYGKGRFSKEIIKYIQNSTSCKIVDLIDKNDLERILECGNNYDHIIVGIISSYDVSDACSLLEEMGIPMQKISTVDRKSLDWLYLPEELINEYKHLL